MEVRERMANTFPYDEFMKAEGIPIHHAVVGVEDVTELPRAPWARIGGLGTFIELTGTHQSQRGIYVAEIPGGEALEPEKHLYEKQIYILKGRGLTQVWQGDRPKLTFEWSEGSVFAIPRNVSHRMFNAGSDPVIFMAVTTAPELINTLDDLDFVFNSDTQFMDLYQDGDRYFAASDLRTMEGWYKQNIWHTNFIPDAHGAALDALEQKVVGGLLTGYRMGKRFPHGHISQWPAGRYHKAHYHGPGAILLGLDGEGYVLAWDSRLGPRPYEAGYGDQVHKVHWGRNSIYSPPDAYFHQHLNTGKGSAKHIAVYGAHHPLGHHAEVDEANGSWKGFLSFKEGGTLIEHWEEDPQVRKEFEDALRQNGVESKMDDSLFKPKVAA
jgi:quercetin dioxygenase-like cupin family protein